MSINIVDIIERNPITTLTGDYTNKLAEKVKKVFTNYEQQLFLSSFFCYLKYDSKNDYVIDLDDVWKWLGFSSKFNAKRLLENKFVIELNYKSLLLPSEKQTSNPRGGHNKETFLMNLVTFKKFCLKADTTKADEVHEYFVKLENIMFEIYKEDCEELKNQVLQMEDSTKEIVEQMSTQREKILLKEYATSGPLVYIIKVKTYETGEYVVKIGHSSKGIHCRYNDHKQNYEECTLLHCFSVDKSREFESFIHNHKNIRFNKTSTLISHERENELFLIGRELTMQMILAVIDENIHTFNYTVSELLRENELLQCRLEMQSSSHHSSESITERMLRELVQSNQLLSAKMDNLEKSYKELHSKSTTPALTTGFNETLATLGPRVQKINPETDDLVHIYDSVSEVMREDNNIKRPSLTKAIQQHTVYNGYRWMLVDRNQNASIIQNLQPTKQTQSQHTGYLAQINNEQTAIVNVFLDRKTAAILNGYKSPSALDTPVKNNTMTKGFFYRLYDDCDETIKSVFEMTHGGSPLLYKNGVGQFDCHDVLQKTFACKYDCIRALQMSDKTLTKALELGLAYNGHSYKMIGARMQWVQ